MGAHTSRFFTLSFNGTSNTAAQWRMHPPPQRCLMIGPINHIKNLEISLLGAVVCLTARFALLILEQQHVI